MAHRIVQRPTQRDEVEDYVRDLAAALEELGVRPGQTFAVMPAADAETPKVRRTDPDTSRKAALANFPRRANQHGKLLRAILDAEDGLTAEEACERTGIRLNSGSTRMSELVRAGWIVENGTRLHGGSEKSVYTATARAREERTVAA